MSLSVYSKKTRVFTIFFLFFLLLSSGQQQKIDSLLSELENHKQADSIRVKLLVNTAWNVIYTNPDGAFEYVEEAFNIANTINWNKGKVVALRQKGVNYYAERNYLKAMEAWQNALKIDRDQELSDKLLVASIYNNLGNVYADIEQYEKALQHYESYLAIATEKNDKNNMVNGLSNIGQVYLELKRPSEALTFFNKALAYAKEEVNEFAIAAIINNIGNTYKFKKQYAEALKHFEEAEERAKKIDNKYVQAPVLNSLCELNIIFEKYDLAREQGEKALQLAKDINTLEWQLTSWKHLSTIYRHSEAHEKALVAYKNHIQLRDSVQGEDKKLELARKEMTFELENQEIKAKAEIEKEKLIKNITLLCGLGILIGAVIGYILYKRKRDAIEQKNMADFKTKVAETELKALRSQMNPHFIFNAMSSIGDYMDNNDLETASDYLVKFSKLTRAILENSEKKWISLEEDIELTRLYIEIESLRLKGKITHTFYVDNTIDVENTLVPPLILQPFIENSIWHGIAKKAEGGNIKISFHKTDDTVVCGVDDNGVGRNVRSEGQLNHKSMGVQITKNRLSIINQLKNAKSSVTMIDKEEGLKVEVKLPLELKF